MIKALSTIVLAAAVTFWAPSLESEVRAYNPDCHINYYLETSGTYDKTTTACRNIQTAVKPGNMQRNCTYLNDSTVFKNVWVCGNWVTCNWNPDHPDQRLSIVYWRGDGTGRYEWTADSWVKIQIAVDTVDYGC